MIKETETKNTTDKKTDCSDREAGNKDIKKNKESKEQFNYDTPFNGGSAYDRAAIKAAKKGKWIADDDDVEEAKQEIKAERGEQKS